MTQHFRQKGNWCDLHLELHRNRYIFLHKKICICNIVIKTSIIKYFDSKIDIDKSFRVNFLTILYNQNFPKRT